MKNQQPLPVDFPIDPASASPIAASRPSAVAVQLAALPYSAPQLVVYGALERVTQQTNSTPIDGGGGF